MRKFIIKLLARQTINSAFSSVAARALGAIVVMLLIYAAYSGFTIYRNETGNRIRFQKEVREHWETMPDKHPHRMAHYGYIVFRPKQPLSVFDFGLESFTGNAIFLEAHQQNTANFSAASFSNVMLRFGEISMAMILQLLVPLVIFFIGFNSIAADRENGTLKLLLTQGASWKELLTGKILGLALIAWSFLIPAFLLIAVFLFMLHQSGSFTLTTGLDALLMLLSYIIYLGIVSAVAVMVSGLSRYSKTALVGLLGIWLVATIILPRATQAAGTYLFPSPTKIAFETGVEEELIKAGDSHDPNDAHYKRLKDSVLKANKITTAEQLNFNYGGFQMKEGERISSDIYDKALQKLQQTYKHQNTLSGIAAFINPFMAIRNLSMGLSSTDFNTYIRFQQQAEKYRYQLAQRMNDLQIQLISNKKLADTARPYSISSAYWKAFPDFTYQPVPQVLKIKNERLSIASLLIWSIFLILLVPVLCRKLKAI